MTDVPLLSGGVKTRYDEVLEQLEMKKMELEEVREEVRQCRQQIVQAEQERRSNENAIKELQVLHITKFS